MYLNCLPPVGLQCIFSEKVLPFIKTPLFVAQNLYDSWQLNNILKVTTGGQFSMEESRFPIEES